MRKFMVVFFVFAFMLRGISMTAFAVDCAKGTLVDRFGNLGKKEKTKQKRVAARKTDRLADCAEKQARETARTV